MHTVRKIAVVFSALLLGMSVAGCGAAPLEKGSPEASVQSLLELRSELTTDSAKYASYVETSMAQALAEDSASRPATQTAPTPPWETPKRTAETTTTAKVTVRWKASKDFVNWAQATVFSLVKTDGRWVVVDANTATRSVGATDAP